MEPRVQQVILPSLWPRKQNTRGPLPGDEKEDGGGVQAASGESGVEGTRDTVQERMEEVRRRVKGNERGFEMPGAMPGVTVT